MNTPESVLHWINLIRSGQRVGPRTSLRTLVGAQDTMHPRIMAMLDKDRFDVCLATCTSPLSRLSWAKRGWWGELVAANVASRSSVGRFLKPKHVSMFLPLSSLFVHFLVLHIAHLVLYF